MTPREKHCLDFIEHATTKAGYPPTFEEIRFELGLASNSGVARLVDRLEEQGWIRREARKARSIEIVRQRDPASLDRFTDADLRAELQRRGVIQ